MASREAVAVRRGTLNPWAQILRYTKRNLPTSRSKGQIHHMLKQTQQMKDRFGDSFTARALFHNTHWPIPGPHKYVKSWTKPLKRARKAYTSGVLVTLAMASGKTPPFFQVALKSKYPNMNLMVKGPKNITWRASSTYFGATLFPFWATLGFRSLSLWLLGFLGTGIELGT